MLPRLFPEILSSIMILAQDASAATDAADDSDPGSVLAAPQSPPLQPFEITISHVSSRFRDVALSTARLWSYIYIDTSKHDPRIVLERTEAYLRRSSGHALDLRVELNGPIIEKRRSFVAAAKRTSQCRLRQAMGAIARESRRWRRLVIVAEYEGLANVGDALIKKLNGVCDGEGKGEGLVPNLEYLFVSTDYTNESRVVESGRGIAATPAPGVPTDQQAHSQPNPFDNFSDTTSRTTFTPTPFTCHLSRLSFLRLRGLAVCLFRPGSLPYLRTLHLDQTKAIPIDLKLFSRFAVVCPALEHLSIYGDIVTSSTGADGDVGLHVPYPTHGHAQPQQQQQQQDNWSTGSGSESVKGSIAICFPELRSLRICGTRGLTYRIVLSHLESPKLKSLVLKDIQERDLEALWEEPLATSLFNGSVKMLFAKPTSRFTEIQSLTISGSDLSRSAYQRLFGTFPRITEFASYSSMELDVAVGLLAGDMMINAPWPELRALTFIFDADLAADDAMIGEMLSRRRKYGFPIHKLRIGVSELDIDDAIEEGDSTAHGAIVVLEKLNELDIWPSDRLYPDVDDILF